MDAFSQFGQLGLTLFSYLSSDSERNTHNDDKMRRIVQEELGKAQNAEQYAFLREMIRILGEKKQEQQRASENEKLKAEVEELRRKLGKADHNRKVQENREWMKDLIEKINTVSSGSKGGYQQNQQSGGNFPKRQNVSPKNVNNDLPWSDGNKGKNFSSKNLNDDLPWSDGNKRRFAAKDAPFVMMSPEQFASNYRGGHHARGGRGGRVYQRGGYGRFHSAPESQGQEMENNYPQRHPNFNQRGNYRGRGHAHGAIPKIPMGNRQGANPLNQDLKELTAKLHSLSTNNVNVELSPEEIIRLKNLLSGNDKTRKNYDIKSNRGPKEDATNNDEGLKTNTNQPERKKADVEGVEKEDAPKKPPKKKEPTEPKVPAPPKQSQSMKLHPLPGFDDAVLQILSDDLPVKDAVYMIQDEGKLLTFQPQTVGQLKILKQKHPKGQLYSSSAIDS